MITPSLLLALILKKQRLLKLKEENTPLNYHHPYNSFFNLFLLKLLNILTKTKASEIEEQQQETKTNSTTTYNNIQNKI
jgi:hypothetical protein